MELIRRLILVLGLLGGVWAYIATTPVLISVSVEDFARSKEQAENRSTGFLYRDKTLGEFYIYRTEGRTKRVDGREWLSFYDEIAAVTLEGVSDGELGARRGLGYYEDHVFFFPDEAPIDEVAGSLAEFSALVYLSIGGVGLGAPTLAVVRAEGADSGGDAPPWMLHPHRSWSWWLILLGLLGYIFLPRAPRRPDDVHYAAAPAVVVPDILGAGLLAFFFGLPILIVTMNGESLLDFSDGWWVIGAIFWFLAIAPVVMLIVSTRNAAFRLRATDDSLELTRWSGHRRIPCADIAAIEPVQWSTPTWLKLLGRLTLLFTWRAALPAVLLEEGRGDGMEIVLRDRSRERIWLSGLLGWEKLVEELAGRGVDVAEGVRERMGQGG
jgi:hypothetical protein